MRAQEAAVYNSEVAMGTLSLLFWHISQGGPRRPTGYKHHSVQFDTFHLVEFKGPRLLHQVTEILVDVNVLYLSLSLERNLKSMVSP